MIQDLSATLKSILRDATLPSLVRTADIDFERPAEPYSPGRTTINLFLYDLRESSELRSNEPVVERQNGRALIRRPPLRVACSYQVTAWSESSTTGEQAVLEQHQLLGEVLRVFTRTSTVADAFLQGALKTQLYPVSLVTAQPDLMRNPAEFWSAMGGKLRPSFTVTAIIAMDQDAPAIAAPVVASNALLLSPIGSSEKHAAVAIGGTVTDSASGLALEAVELSLVELQLQTRSDRDGRFQFPAVARGSHSLRAAKPGYSVYDQAIEVPGTSPTSFDIQLVSSPP